MLRRGLLSASLRHVHRHRLRLLSSGPTPPVSPAPSAPSTTSSSTSLPLAAPPPSHHLAPHRGPRRLTPLLALSMLSLATAACTLYLSNDNLEETLERSRASAARVVERMQHTWTASRVLCKSLLSVLSSANQEVRSGFELRVAALLADIAAASAVRRAAIVSTGGGAIVDWLLDSVVRGATQAESPISPAPPSPLTRRDPSRPPPTSPPSTHPRERPHCRLLTRRLHRTLHRNEPRRRSRHSYLWEINMHSRRPAHAHPLCIALLLCISGNRGRRTQGV